MMQFYSLSYHISLWKTLRVSVAKNGHQMSDIMSLQNMKSVALMVSEKNSLDMTDRQTYRRTDG